MGKKNDEKTISYLLSPLHEFLHKFKSKCISGDPNVDSGLWFALQDDVKQQPLNQGIDLVNDGDDEPMGSEEDVAADEVKAKNAGRRQNEKLYDAAGILNTKLMRAEKKRRKKANKSSGDAMEHDEDYYFKVDYVKKGSTMDDGEENEEAGGSNQTRFEVLASGVEIDE